MGRIFSAILILLLAIGGRCLAKDAWQKAGPGINESVFNTVAVHPEIPGMVFAGSNRRLYQSTDGGKNWKVVLDPKCAVNFILIDNSKIFAATEKGLYACVNYGRRWEIIYRGRHKRSNILCIAKSGPDIILGTESGVMKGSLNKREWMLLDNGVPEDGAVSICVKEPFMYILTRQGLFKSSDNGASFIKVMVNKDKYPDQIDDEINEQSEQEMDESNSAESLRQKYVTLDNLYPEVIYLATEKGVMKSSDSAASWQMLTNTGLLNNSVNCILAKGGELYAATDNGVYAFEKEKGAWRGLYKGMDSGKIMDLAIDESRNIIWAAGEKGLFYLEISFDKKITADCINDFSFEPKINEVQAMAILYAEVEPDKIRRWRKQARLKALLPKLSFGYDKSKSNTYEIYTSSSMNYYVSGPQDLSSGWDVSVSWELGDLIWGTDQTSIDVRSRLMVELRNDILEEVNRAYFERRRLQHEFINAGLNQNKIAEKKLRIEELTANLDAFTGGWFSDKIAKTKNH